MQFVNRFYNLHKIKRENTKYCYVVLHALHDLQGKITRSYEIEL